MLRRPPADRQVGGTGGVSNEDQPLPLRLNVFRIIADTAKALPGREHAFTPLSDYLCEVALREAFRDIVPEVDRYERAFDRFEYLPALVNADLQDRSVDRAWGPIGSFSWRGGPLWTGSTMYEVGQEIERQGDTWPLLREGFFEGSLERLRTLKDVYDETLRRPSLERCWSGVPGRS